MQNIPTLSHFYTGINNDMVRSILDTIINKSPEMKPALIGADDNDDGALNTQIRNCQMTPIEPVHWINGLLDYYVRTVNDELFDFDLVNWHSDLQFLHYKGKGTGYKWHCDNAVTENEIGVRKLTVVLGLSNHNDYEGGEFQIILPGNNQKVDKIKLGMGECIIFPSTSTHRVTPLKSGERSVIVGWYGGPDFR
jgi:predicted 2-oxoglutarate/Fe(II)-dependent dioxygenase YbiX